MESDTGFEPTILMSAERGDVPKWSSLDDCRLHQEPKRMSAKDVNVWLILRAIFHNTTKPFATHNATYNDRTGCYIGLAGRHLVVCWWRLSNLSYNIRIHISIWVQSRAGFLRYPAAEPHRCHVRNEPEHTTCKCLLPQPSGRHYMKLRRLLQTSRIARWTAIEDQSWTSKAYFTYDATLGWGGQATSQPQWYKDERHIWWCGSIGCPFAIAMPNQCATIVTEGVSANGDTSRPSGSPRWCLWWTIARSLLRSGRKVKMLYFVFCSYSNGHSSKHLETR
jgi:diadenosine tetraphosphatase ApaH/serine/threonine PP2A family protein phosphatase